MTAIEIKCFYSRHDVKFKFSQEDSGAVYLVMDEGTDRHISGRFSREDLIVFCKAILGVLEKKIGIVEEELP